MPVIALVSDTDHALRTAIRDILPPDWDLLECHHERDRLAAEGGAVQIVYGNVRPHEAPALPDLRWVQATWAGIENLIGPGHLPAEVVITNVRGARATAMSEHVLAGLLWVARGLAHLPGPEGWRAGPEHAAFPLAGSRVLVLGCGAIGRRLVPKLRALDMQVSAVTSDGRAVAGADAVGTLADAPALAADCRHVVCLLPATPTTHTVIDAGLLAALQGGGALVNVSRGGPLDEAALLAAIHGGQLSGAVLDVTDPEPPPADSPLRNTPRILLTGHSSYQGAWDVDQAPPAVFLDNLKAWFAGDRAAMRNLVDRSRGY